MKHKDLLFYSYLCYCQNVYAIWYESEIAIDYLWINIHSPLTARYDKFLYD